MWYVCNVLYVVLYIRVSCFVVRGCAVSKKYINVCNCDLCSVVNVYLDHLKFCVVCINGCCCFMPSETYGRNGVTPIFRSFHRTASSTTDGWSRWNSLMCFFIYRSEHYGLIFRGYHILIIRSPLFFILCTFPFFSKYTLHAC